MLNSGQMLAQNTLNLNELKGQKIPELNAISDKQLQEMYRQMKSQGLTINDMEKEAARRGLSETDWKNIRTRLELLEQDELKHRKQEPTESMSETNIKTDEPEPAVNAYDELFRRMEIPVFGMDIFRSKKLNFEPGLNIPTPVNYNLGAGDELQLELFGSVEQSHKVKVTPDGFVRLPLAGNVQVNGLSIEQARARIQSALTRVYPRIQQGEVKLSVSLGTPRSIRVHVIGEAIHPGSYTIPGFAGVFNALYAAGGPSEKGSMRDIQVIRNNKVIAHLDVYEFLMKGSASGNIRLHEQDVIRIASYTTRIQLKGYVKHEGYFEIKKGESLQDVLSYAGGFENKAYRKQIRVTRNTEDQLRVNDIASTSFSVFQPETGDVYEIAALLERYENRIHIEGAVFRPGNYALENNSTIKELIEKAGGLKEDAFMTRGIIYRLKPDHTREMVSFQVGDVMQGKATDVPLQREDFVQIASNQEMHESYLVTLSGEVLHPGTYPFAQHMKIEDLIIAAGGLKESASLSRIEVARRKLDVDRSLNGSEISIVKQFTIQKDLQSTDMSFELLPNDMITVFPAPGYMVQKSIQVEGEVTYPGKYAISHNHEKISDVLKRCGGLNVDAFPAGAMLLRLKPKSVIEDVLQTNKLRALKKQTKDTSDVKENMADQMQSPYDIVGIDLNKILKKPGSRADLHIQDGDILRIPSEKQTVLVSGEVLYPVRLKFEKHKSFKRYISGAGGFGPQALRRHAYVVYANGTARATRNCVLFKWYPDVQPGSEIVVPQKDNRKPVSAVEIASITTSITSLMILVITLLK